MKGREQSAWVCLAWSLTNLMWPCRAPELGPPHTQEGFPLGVGWGCSGHPGLSGKQRVPGLAPSLSPWAQGQVA